MQCSMYAMNTSCSMGLARTITNPALPLLSCTTAPHRFEYVFDYVEGEPITEADAEGKHIIDPYTYATKFYRPNGY